MRLHALVAPLFLLVPGCAQLLGIDDFESDGAGGSVSTSTTGTLAGSPTSGTMAGPTGSSSTGGGPCTGNETRACYYGPVGTENQGNCLGGMETCDGTMFGPCAGEVQPATEDFYVTGDESCDGVARGDTVWNGAFDTTDIAIELGSVADAAGNTYVFGFYQGELNFGPAATDALPVPTDRAFFLTSFDTNGTHRWSKSMAVDYDSTFGSITLDTAGNEIFVVGILESQIDIDGLVLTSPDDDFFVASFDTATGARAEARVLPIGIYRGLPYIAATTDRIVIGGTFAFGFSLDGHMISTKDTAVFVAELEPGNLNVSSLIKVGDVDTATNGSTHLGAMGTDAQGRVYLAGDFSGYLGIEGDLLTTSNDMDFDAFVVRLDGGVVDWGASAGGPSAHDFASSLDVADDGSILVGGGFAGTVDLRPPNGVFTTLQSSGPTDFDAYLWKINAGGNTAWAKKFGDTAQQAEWTDGGLLLPPFVARLRPDNGVALGGGFQGTLNFGGQDLASAGDFDAYVAVFDADGNHTWSKRFGNPGPGQAVGSLNVTPSDEMTLTLLNPAKMDLGLGELSATGPVQLVHAKITP